MLKKNQNGNVLFLVLLAVAMFAALSYAATSSMRGRGGDTASENNLIKSSNITQFGGAVRTAVAKLIVTNKCTVEEISFEGPPFDGSDTDYVNAASPADFSCHIFHPNGGSLSRMPPPKDANDGRDWAYIEARIHKIGPDQTLCGPDCNELIITLGGLTKSVCEKLNKKLTGSTTIVQQDNGVNYENKKYTGSFTSGVDFDGAGVAGLYEVCTQDANGTYYYYNVLYAR